MADLTVLGLGVLATPMAMKLLGPTADYLGGELKTLAEKRLQNIQKIFSNTTKKLEDKLDEPGQVPPKVLKAILNDGSYCDDAVSVEYFGGVLASSRTATNRDDRGSRIAKIIDSLSSYQIRTHYVIYSAVAQLFAAGAHDLSYSQHRSKMELFILFDAYVHAMQFTEEEYNDQLMHHIFNGLSNEGLIEAEWSFGSQEELKSMGRASPGDGIVCTPSALGAELFLWAFGHGDKALNFMLTDSLSATIDGIPQLGSPAIATKAG